MDTQKNYDEFTKYVSNFDINNPVIKQRFEHSLRVKNISNELAKSLNMNNEEVDVASLIGLLHDTARFYQITKYGSISYCKTIDHGDYGVEILFVDNLISNFDVDKKYYDVIKDAIKNHNKMKIIEPVSNLEFCKIIRDADKLDILYIISNKVNEMGTEPISEDISKAFYSENEIKYSDIKTTGDKILVYLGYVFDFNYKFSFKYIKDNKLYEKIYEKLNNESLKEYFDYVYKYIDDMLK